jgi:hypothetical protein
MYKNIVIQPQQFLGDEESLYTLNKKTSMQPFAVDYVKTPDGHYTSLDPRIYDSPRDQRLELDTPPLQVMGTQPQGDIYKMEGNKTGFYKDYQSINGGNIKYYTDIGNDTPFGNPPYNNPSYTIPTLMVDPMDNMLPYYLRVPVFNKNNSVYQYTFDQDQCEWREDLMAQQNMQNNGFSTYQFYNNPARYFPSYKYKTQGHFPWTM